MATSLLRALVLLAVLALSSAHLASTWPERPLSKDVNLEQHYASEHHAHARALAEEVDKPPTDDELAMFQIIAVSSIGFAVVFFFAIGAMFNMEYTNDSLLYSKSKSD